MSPPAGCVVCGSTALTPHLAVSGEMGAEGLIPTTSRFGVALGDIVRCPACGHMQLDPMPCQSLLERAYAQAASEDYVGEEAGQRATARAALARIEHYSTGRGRLLDLGCWVGFLMAEARERGWQPVGVEPSRFASAFAREHLGLEVISAELFDAELPPAGFAAVTLGDVIEHLVTPGEALTRIHGWLEPGGLLWMALPDAGSLTARMMGRRWWSVIPTHVQYFTRASIERLLERSGFQVLEVRSSPKAFSVRYYLERTRGYSPRLERSLVRTAERLGLADRLWAPDFRDRMAIIAARR